MAGVSWAEGASNGTEASSGGSVEAELQHSLFAATYSVVFVLGLLGNALSLYLLSCRVKHLSHSYIFLLQLALLDTLFVWVLPLHIHSHLRGGSWSFGDTACRLSGALFSLHLSLSIAFFTCICVDVYVAALHPFTSIQLRAGHHVLLATALWLLALGLTVPLGLRGVRNSTACSEPFPDSSWAQPPAPQPILALLLGFAIPFALIVLGFPLLARSISQSQHRVSRRKALGTIYIILAICALCFVPQQLSHLLQFLLSTQLVQGIPSPIPGVQRVTSALVSCSCCLNPLLCYFHCSSRQWHCPLRLRFRSKRVFTICDQNFGDPSWDYKLRLRLGRKIHRAGIH
ncbi:LPAR6 protein, partial [Climacteris rufus]|nr:LPAR6 protein [Climacteris rufus]